MITKVKRLRTDKCNICRLSKPMTWDHVPPRGGITITSVEIEKIYAILSHNKPSKTIYQNGVKYRTICKECNSEIGKEYDPTLNEFNSTITAYFNSNLIPPKFAYIKSKPNRLIRAILAHLLSAKENIDDVIFDATIRSFIFDDKIDVPDNINIYFWIYPYDCTIILRDCMLSVKQGEFDKFTFCHIIKYFPIAFIVTDSTEFRGLSSLTKYKSNNIDDEKEIRIDFERIESFDWPERVDNTNVLITSTETSNGIFAKPRENLPQRPR